jgi:hypothetical protein
MAMVLGVAMFVVCKFIKAGSNLANRRQTVKELKLARSKTHAGLAKMKI